MQVRFIISNNFLKTKYGKLCRITYSTNIQDIIIKSLGLRYENDQLETIEKPSQQYLSH
jgi:hypothetical protein